jgi:sugar transferase (PEP-CTERM/EpsH1 system associated)
MTRLHENEVGYRALICHVIYGLDYGGLENGLINVINRLPAERYQHVIITLAGFSDYGARLRDGVHVECVEKKAGPDFGVYVRLWRRFRVLKPTVVHTRNLATLESQLPALLAGVRHRIHGEHGRDVHDLDNSRIRYRLLRKIFSYIVQRYVSVSRELEAYLTTEVGVAAARVTRICNGVDTEKFHPSVNAKRTVLEEAPFDLHGRIVIGTIGRMQAVKDQTTLAHAFIDLIRTYPQARDLCALVMVGSGPLRDEVAELLKSAGVSNLVWLPGSRDDTPELLRGFDIFVLPSLAEGISNTILEAMASGLPVVATDVGGNRELVVESETGFLVPRSNPKALADAIRVYASDAKLRHLHGSAGRQRACNEFSLDGMVTEYERVYDELIMS